MICVITIHSLTGEPDEYDLFVATSTVVAKAAVELTLKAMGVRWSLEEESNGARISYARSSGHIIATIEVATGIKGPQRLI